MIVMRSVLVAALVMLCAGWAVPARAAAPLRLAVVGDSDSHAYHDSLRFSGQDGQRGGAYHATTLQWTEVLDRLRGSQVDQGRWGEYGTYGIVAKAEELLGLPTRAPEKEDFEYNFAVSGARCTDLMDAERQVPRLVRLMDQAPAQWRDGVVLIRIGVNSFGQYDSLEKLAADPRDPAVSPEIDRCIADMKRAVALLRQRHPQTRVVLVGIFNNAHVGGSVHKFQSPRMQANIASALDRYDDALKGMAARDPRVVFFDDRAWFAARWGGRSADGSPAYRPVRIAGRFAVANTQGDAPSNAVLGDGHAGVAWNALWAQALVELLNQRFRAGVAPITDADILPLVEAGTRRRTTAGRRASPP